MAVVRRVAGSDLRYLNAPVWVKDSQGAEERISGGRGVHEGKDGDGDESGRYGPFSAPQSHMILANDIISTYCFFQNSCVSDSDPTWDILWTIKRSLNVGKQIWYIERVYVQFNTY